MADKLNLEVLDALHGAQGELSVNSDTQRMALAGKPFAWLEDLRGLEAISQPFHYDYDGSSTTFTFDYAPTKFIRLYATDGRTNLYELVPGDYTIDGNQVTINPDYLPGDGWYIEGLYTYAPAGGGEVPTPIADALLARIVALEQRMAAQEQSFGDHVSGDNLRWQQFADTMTLMRAEFVKIAQEVYEGTAPDMDTANPTQIFGTAGLLTLGSSNTYQVPINGWIIVSYSAVLGVAPILLIDGNSVDYGGLSLLGSGVTSEIQVNAGQQISATGVLGLGSSFNVTFYPNK